MRILLIEDNPGDVRLLEEYLYETSLPSVTLLTAGSIASASKHLASDPVDLIMLDLGLPDSQGIDSVRKVRKLAPLVPIVVLTGATDEELGVEAVREGAQDYLIKNGVTAQVIAKAARHAIERSQVEIRIRESEDRYRTLFETMAQGVVYHDSSGRITSCNPAAERILGLSCETMKGRTLAELGWQAIGLDGSDYRAEEHPALLALKRGAEASGVMGVRNAKSGSYRWIDVHAMPRFRSNEESPYEVFASFADITELRELEEQRDIARKLQEALLDIPQELPGVRFGHLYRSATRAAQIGGDFYDVFEAQNGHIGLLIGDVSGHGVEAARIATLVKDTVHAFTRQFHSPHLVLGETNRLLVERNRPGFVTVFLAFLDPNSGALVYSSAGHPGPLLKTGERLDLLGTASAPMGVFADARYRDCEEEIPKGSLLLFYTDGITEARRDDTFFGEERLSAALKRLGDCAVEKLPSLLLDEALLFSGGRLADDVALLAVNYVGKAGGRETA